MKKTQDAICNTVIPQKIVEGILASTQIIKTFIQTCPAVKTVASKSDFAV
jgi:hypothetical protein